MNSDRRSGRTCGGLCDAIAATSVGQGVAAAAECRIDRSENVVDIWLVGSEKRLRSAFFNRRRERITRASSDSYRGRDERNEREATRHERLRKREPLDTVLRRL